MLGSFTILSIVISVTSVPEADASGFFLRFFTYNLFSKFILYSKCEIEPWICPGRIRSTRPSCFTPRQLIGVVVGPGKVSSNFFKKDCERFPHDPSTSARAQNPASNRRNCTSIASILRFVPCGVPTGASTFQMIAIWFPGGPSTFMR